MAQQEIIRQGMTLETMIQTQIQIVSRRGETWTRRQACTALCWLGWITSQQWLIAMGQ